MDILIVDDEERMRLLLKANLEAEGHRCSTAGGGEEAIVALGTRLDGHQNFQPSPAGAPLSRKTRSRQHSTQLWEDLLRAKSWRIRPIKERWEKPRVLVPLP